MAFEQHYELEVKGLSVVLLATLRCSQHIAGNPFFTESLILAQDERWRRA